MSASVSAKCMSYACRSQRRMLNHLKLKLKRVVSCHVGWETNPGPLEEQQIFLKPTSVFYFILIQCFCLLVWFGDLISQNPGWPYVGEDDLGLLIFFPPPSTGVTDVSHRAGFLWCWGLPRTSTLLAEPQPNPVRFFISEICIKPKEERLEMCRMYKWPVFL